MKVHIHAHPLRHDREGYMKYEVKEPEGDEAKAKNKKDTIKSHRIIAYSIRDNLCSVFLCFHSLSPNLITFNTFS